MTLCPRCDNVRLATGQTPGRTVWHCSRCELDDCETYDPTADLLNEWMNR